MRFSSSDQDKGTPDQAVYGLVQGLRETLLITAQPVPLRQKTTADGAVHRLRNNAASRALSASCSVIKAPTSSGSGSNSSGSGGVSLSAIRRAIPSSVYSSWTANPALRSRRRCRANAQGA
jgi:hypothetical protein